LLLIIANFNKAMPY